MALNSGTQLLTINERLPPEMMSDIFMESCTTLTMPRNPDGIAKKDLSTPSQLNLTSVCRLWRSIAHSTPALWTSLRIYIPCRDIPQRIQDIEQWLSRSGQLPLSIQVHSSKLRLKLSNPLVDELFNLVESYSHRWENLEIRVKPGLLYHFRGSSISPSILKTLILVPHSISPYDNARSLDFGTSIPSPTHVSLFASYVWPVKIRWNNVTCFAARDIHVDQALKILQRSPQLQECFLFVSGKDTMDFSLSPPFLHARLETLRVSFYGEDILDLLLDSISLPFLKHLHHGYGYSNTLQIDSIIKLLNRSGCSLKSFSLAGAYDITEDMIIRLLFAMPHLETLTLGPSYDFDYPYITDKILNMFADTAVITTHLNDRPGEPFLPKLRSFKYTGIQKFSWPRLPFVFGRRGTWEPHASGSSKNNQRPLHSFRMELYVLQKPGESIIAELKRLKAEEGYDINILDIDAGILYTDELYTL
jgi:hypothetical protein